MMWSRLEPLEIPETRVTSSPSATPPADLTTLPSSQQPPLTQTSPTPMPPLSFYYRGTIRMAVRTQPALSLGLSAKVIEVMALSPPSFCKRYGSSYETPSSSSSSSPTLPSQKRYQGTSELIVDTETETEESKEEGTDSETEETASEDQQQQVVPVENTAEDEPSGLGYRAARRRSLELAEGSVPSTYEIGQSSRSTPYQQMVNETPTPRLPICTTWEDPKDSTVYMDIECNMPPVHSPFQTPSSPVQIPSSPGWSLEPLLEEPVIPSTVASPVPTTIIHEGDVLKIRAQLELHGSILYDHIKRLNALSLPFLRVMVETSPSCFLGRIIRPPESNSVARKYEDQKEIHDLRMQRAINHHELQELRDRVTSLKQRTAKLHNDILMFQQHHEESLSEAWNLTPATRRTIYQSAGGNLCNNESWNDPRDFAKPVKAISLPQDVPSTFDRRLTELENQVQRLMEAHLTLMQPTQVNKITSSLSNFMASQDTSLSKFEADFKQQQSKMTNKIDTVLKSITNRIAKALPSDTVKNSKLNVNSTTSILSARSYPTKDPQCSNHTHGSINTITIHPKQQSNSYDSKAEEEEKKREGNLEDTYNIAYNEEQRDTPQLGPKDTTVDNLGPNRDDEGIEWLDVEEPLYLVDTNDYDRGCRKPSDLEDGFYRDTIKLGPEYVTGIDDKGRKAYLLEDKQIPSVGHLDDIIPTPRGKGPSLFGPFRQVVGEEGFEPPTPWKLRDFSFIAFSAAIQSGNEHLKSKAIDFTTFQNLQAQVKELKSENRCLKLSVEELTQARELVEVTLRQRGEIVSDQFEKIRLFEEQSEIFYEVQSEFDSEIFHDTQDNSEKDFILSLQTQLKETIELVERLTDEKYCALKDIENLN
uniref:Uncharacterized protein n=1 Tax=Tanacetum cinerariifolium TaxID=118510 RepID=A0A6L2NXK0_TANCI|nr:hypothetical protein [Tanacetum cinerariifolium]